MGDWRKDEAEIIVQIHPREYLEPELTNLAEFEQRKYGSTVLVFYRQK